MRKISRFIFVALLFTQNAVSAKNSEQEDKSDLFSMNGYTMTQFGDFSKTWELVTVRFRKDTGEMRITYANKDAWNVLKKNSTDYPDGAVFAKISILTKDDPAFPSSAVPSGARRIQFMVKDKKKHKETDGWGYALFDAEGKTYPGDLKTATMACVACHRVVPERGYVFSQPMNLSVFANHKIESWNNRFRFKKIKISELPKKIAALIPENYKLVSSLQGELAKYPFAGTLDEIRPLLTKESLHSQMPAVLISEDGKLFSLVFADSKKTCADKEKAFKGVHTLPNKTDSLFEIEFCASIDPS